MMGSVDATDFYEDDEPIEKILAILERPADGITQPVSGVCLAEVGDVEIARNWATPSPARPVPSVV